jgi:hypothetical protein
MVGTDWLPMDTAPLDGTHVLLWFPGSDLPVRVGCWMPEAHGWPGHWFSFSGILKRRLEPGPSHWMSLPEAPPQDGSA